VRAESDAKLAPFLHALKWADKINFKERNEMEADLVLFRRKRQWQLPEDEELNAITKIAMIKLGKIEAMRAKDYRELFSPTCPKVDLESSVGGKEYTPSQSDCDFIFLPIHAGGPRRVPSSQSSTRVRSIFLPLLVEKNCA
jgi:hypothetical protein